MIILLSTPTVPTAAPTVTVEPVGASSLKVKWEKLPIAKARGAILEYDVYYRESDKGSIKVEAVPGDVYEHVLSGLSPDLMIKLLAILTVVMKQQDDIPPRWYQRPYIIETMHSCTLPM